MSKAELIGGFTVGAISSLVALAVHYSIWVSLAVAIGCFVAVNGLCLLFDIAVIEWKARRRR